MKDEPKPTPTYFKGSRAGKKPLKKDPLAHIRADYDAIVIGSGIGGLTTANILARSGHRVCILEQHYNFGGYATWFKRKGGHLFDVSLHGFPVGMKKTCRRYWTEEIAKRVVPLDKIAYDNPQFSIETDFTAEDFTAKLVDVFGIPLATVEAFFRHLRGMDFFADTGESVAELFERYFPGRNDVHRLLMEPISYANGSLLDDPAITYGIVFANFSRKGIYTFSGGTDVLIRAMKDELTKNGVELYANALVDRIIVEDGVTRGVVVNGKFIAAPVVLSNANIKTTVEKLVGPAYLPAEYVASCRAVRLNNSSCQVYMGIERGATIPFVADLLFTSTRPDFDSPSLCDLRGESRTFSFYYPKTRPGDDRHAIVSSLNANYSDWADLSPAEYETEKEYLIASTLESIERYIPGVGTKITHVEAATPRTFAFYTRHPGGTSFGTKFEGLKVSQDLPLYAAGLYHAGSVGIIMSGWLGVANYGVIVANKIEAYLMGRDQPTPTNR